MELQRPQSSEEISDKEPSSEQIISVQDRRATRKKDISSSYSSLIPKSRDKISIMTESTVEQQSIPVKSNTVLFLHWSLLTSSS